MSLISLVATLIVVGVLRGQIITYILMDGRIQKILNIIVVILFQTGFHALRSAPLHVVKLKVLGGAFDPVQFAVEPLPLPVPQNGNSHSSSCSSWFVRRCHGGKSMSPLLKSFKNKDALAQAKSRTFLSHRILVVEDETALPRPFLSEERVQIGRDPA